MYEKLIRQELRATEKLRRVISWQPEVFFTVHFGEAIYHRLLGLDHIVGGPASPTFLTFSNWELCLEQLSSPKKYRYIYC